jgi:hypothetical protein
MIDAHVPPLSKPDVSKLLAELVEMGYEIHIKGDTLHDHPLIRVELWRLDRIERAASAVVPTNALLVLGLTVDCPEALKYEAQTRSKTHVEIRRHCQEDDSLDNYDNDGKPCA